MARGRIKHYAIDVDLPDVENVRRSLNVRGIDVALIGNVGEACVVRLTGAPTGLVTFCTQRGFDEVLFVRNGVGYAR